MFKAGRVILGILGFVFMASQVHAEDLNSLAALTDSFASKKPAECDSICKKLQGKKFEDELTVQGMKKRESGNKAVGPKYDLFVVAKLANGWKVSLNFLITQADAEQIKKGLKVRVSGTFTDGINISYDPSKKLWWRLSDGEIVIPKTQE